MADYTFAGRVEGVFVGRDPDTLLSERTPSAQALLGGFEGDKHAGWTRRADARVPWYPRGTLIRNERQVSLVSSEELVRIGAALGVEAVRAAWLGANLELSGIPSLTLLPRGTRLVFASGAVLMVELENIPCRGPGREIQRQLGARGIESRFVKAALHLRGVVASVERPGPITEGDSVTIEITAQSRYPPI